MSRTALRSMGRALVVLASLATLSVGEGLDPHLDAALVPGGCGACHAGHGASGSPMLIASQREVCLACHGHQSDLDHAAARGDVSRLARPVSVGRALSQPYPHPISARAFSRRERRVVTCSSCHSPHRGSLLSRPADGWGPRRSTKDPSRFEFELCEGCHGSGGSATQSPDDISRLFNPANRSYHPVEAPAREEAPSVSSELAGREISCTDCHGNSDPIGARGPHGSAEPFILSASYATLDGGTDPASTYALCFRCHELQAVLQSSVFEAHGQHITQIRASCASCHNPHGSVGNRALIRFGETGALTSVAPSLATGRLAFVSDAPGSGACFLTCHGRDHAPEGYGAMQLEPRFESLSEPR